MGVLERLRHVARRRCPRQRSGSSLAQFPSNPIKNVSNFSGGPFGGMAARSPTRSPSTSPTWPSSSSGPAGRRPQGRRSGRRRGGRAGRRSRRVGGDGGEVDAGHVAACTPALHPRRPRRGAPRRHRHRHRRRPRGRHRSDAGGRIWVNAADRPDDCSFILPAVARNGSLSIAVSTDGTSPALAQRLRDERGRPAHRRGRRPRRSPRRAARRDQGAAASRPRITTGVARSTPSCARRPGLARVDGHTS